MKAIIAITLSAALLLGACQKPQEPVGNTRSQMGEKQDDAAVVTPQQVQPPQIPPAQKSEENVPLITEVMAKEELQAYLKEKGIPILTKETFEEPELVWESTFTESIKMFHGISDLTEKGNCIAISIPPDVIAEAKKIVLFLDSKGNIRKKLAFNNIKDKTTMKNKVMYSLYPAMSGRYSGVYKMDIEKTRATFTYYDEYGNRLWEKLITDQQPTDETPITVSYDGSVIAATLGNPRWNTHEEEPGDQNINKLTFYDSKGNLLSEYAGFRNVSIGKFSDDGEHYAAIIWWSGGVNTGGAKLVYIRTKDGKVLWERPFSEYYSDGIGRDDDLEISEQGSFVSAVKWPAGKIEDSEIQVFDKLGSMIVRTKSGGPIYENGLFFGRYIMDLANRKILSVTISAYTYNPKNYLYWKGGGREASFWFLSIDGTVLWEIPNEGFIDYSRDGKYLKVLGYSKTEKLYKLKIFRFQTSGGLLR